jgi:hypothetical protein
MQNYIRQLISDMHNARTKVEPPLIDLWQSADLSDEGEIEDLAFVEEYMYGIPKQISDITGIGSELLPVPDMLQPDEAALLAVELELLLNHFNFYPDFPVNYPVNLRYPLLRKIWDDEHVTLSFGESHIEFCSYESENCPFLGYCNTCEEIEKEIKEGPKAGPDFEPDPDDLIFLP